MQATFGWLFLGQLFSMIRSLLSRLIVKKQVLDPTAKSCAQLLACSNKANYLAKNLREELQLEAKAHDFCTQTLPQFVAQLAGLGWSAQEIEKVKVYADFYSGANERGYQRVMQQGLARDDYTLFMTACVHCYLAGRYIEGAALLDVFHPEDDPDTDWSEYLAFAGYIYLAAGRPIGDSVVFFDQALNRGIFSPTLAFNAYPIYFEAGRHEQCRILQELAHHNCPTDPDVMYALACVELARGYYGEGFRLMEARYRMPELAHSMNISLMQHSRWNGQSLAGKQLLVHGEQGLGDMVMMARYLPLLRAQGAQLVMDGRAEASSLMADNFPYCKFVAADIHSQLSEPFDYWTGIMSLPYHFKTTADNVPSTDQYLAVPDEQAIYWQKRIQDLAGDPTSRRIGIAWSGNPGHRADKRRSMPFELIRAFVIKHPEIRFFSLQTDAPLNYPNNFISLADELITLADTAAAIASMDLIISIDTSVIHLAGALGRQAWLLLPHRYEWRWGLEGETNCWYRSVLVLRQQQPGDWPGVLDDVHMRLQRHDPQKVKV